MSCVHSPLNSTKFPPLDPSVLVDPSVITTSSTPSPDSSPLRMLRIELNKPASVYQHDPGKPRRVAHLRVLLVNHDVAPQYSVAPRLPLIFVEIQASGAEHPTVSNSGLRLLVIVHVLHGACYSSVDLDSSNPVSPIPVICQKHRSWGAFANPRHARP